MAVKSTNDTDPTLAMQRALITQKQRNRKNLKMLAAIRSNAAASQGGPTLPKYLKRSVSAAAKTQQTDDKAVNNRRNINSIVTKYL